MANMTTFDRLRALCRSETRKEISSPEEGDYQTWLAGKRPFTRDELAGQWVIKIGDQCGGYLAQLRSDGTISELEIFQPGATWPGNWEVDEAGVLHVTVPSGNEQTGPVLCSLDVVASPKGNLHAGAETTTLTDHIEMFKFVTLGPEVVLPEFGDGSKIGT